MKECLCLKNEIEILMMLMENYNTKQELLKETKRRLLQASFIDNFKS